MNGVCVLCCCSSSSILYISFVPCTLFVTFLDLFSYCLVFYTLGWREYSILPLWCGVIFIFTWTLCIRLFNYLYCDSVLNLSQLRIKVCMDFHKCESVYCRLENPYTYFDLSCFSCRMNMKFIYIWYSSIGFESRFSASESQSRHKVCLLH